MCNLNIQSPVCNETKNFISISRFYLLDMCTFGTVSCTSSTFFALYFCTAIFGPLLLSFTLYFVADVLYTYCTLYAVYFVHTLYFVASVLYTCCTLYAVYFVHTLYFLASVLYTYCTLYALYIVRSLLCTQCTWLRAQSIPGNYVQIKAISLTLSIDDHVFSSQPIIAHRHGTWLASGEIRLFPVRIDFLPPSLTRTNRTSSLNTSQMPHVTHKHSEGNGRKVALIDSPPVAPSVADLDTMHWLYTASKLPTFIELLN